MRASTASSGAALRAMPKKVNNVMIKAIGIPVRYDRVPGGRYPRMVKVKVGWAYIQPGYEDTIKAGIRDYQRENEGLGVMFLIDPE